MYYTHIHTYEIGIYVYRCMQLQLNVCAHMYVATKLYKEFNQQKNWCYIFHSYTSPDVNKN